MREHEARNARGDRLSRSSREAQRQLDKDLLPVIGRIRVEAVSRLHVMQVIEALADRGSYVAADRALGLIRAIYNWGCGTGRVNCNPTLGLKKRNALRAKTRVLSADEIRAFWKVTEDGAGITPAIRCAQRLELLTGARIGEVIGTARSELDLTKRVWTIPGARTKNGREHILPLSPLAVSIFSVALQLAEVSRRRRAEREGQDVETTEFLFPSAVTDGPILAHAATRCVVRNRSHFQ
jgi:integrase